MPLPLSKSTILEEEAHIAAGIKEEAKIAAECYSPALAYAMRAFTCEHIMTSLHSTA